MLVQGMLQSVFLVYPLDRLRCLGAPETRFRIQISSGEESTSNLEAIEQRTKAVHKWGWALTGTSWIPPGTPGVVKMQF